MKCVSKVRLDGESCLPKCSGLQIPSYDEDSIQRITELKQSLDNFNSKLLSVVNGIRLEAEHVILPPSLTSWSR